MNPRAVIRVVYCFAILVAAGSGCSTSNAPYKGGVYGKEDESTKRIPYAYPGDVLVRLKKVVVSRGFYESMDTRVSATFVPIEYVYQGGNGFGGGGGGAGPAWNQKPVETEQGAPFVLYFSDLGLRGSYAKSMGNLILSCADESNPGQLNLDLILAVPADDAKKDVNYNFEPDWTNWVVQSVEVHK